MTTHTIVIIQINHKTQGTLALTLTNLIDEIELVGIVVAMGDFNGDLGNSLGNRGTVNSN